MDTPLCIIWGDTPPVVWGTASVTYSDVKGGWPGIGNISSDPQFMPDGYHLTNSSPCINAGDPDGNYTGQTDIDGNPRVMSGRVDMGADECRGTAVQVAASAVYRADLEQLEIGAFAYDMAGNRYITEGDATYYIPGLGRSGSVTYIMANIWGSVIDLSSDAPEPGQYSVIVTIGSSSAFAQFSVVSNTSQIIGTVKDVYGAPVDDAELYLYRGTGIFRLPTSFIDSNVTEPDGSFRFDNLDPGWYAVIVTADDYLGNWGLCLLSTAETGQVHIALASSRSLAQLVSEMRSLRGAVEDTMDYEAFVMSEISNQAVSDLSVSLDAWDALSFIGGLLGGLPSDGGGLREAITNEATRQKMDLALREVFKRQALKTVISKAFDRYIESSAQALLPADMDNWAAFSEDELKQLDVWVEATNLLDSEENAFEANAPLIEVPEDFSFGSALRAVSSQRQQLDTIRAGEALCLVALPEPYDPNHGCYALSVPMGRQVWLSNHAAISVTGGINKISTVVEVVAGGITVATGGGGGVAGTIYAGAKVVKQISAIAETALKFTGAIVYAGNAKGWAQDMALLPLSYTSTKAFLEEEASNPHYFSYLNSFSAEASMDLHTGFLNALWPPFGMVASQNATIEVTNTSNITTKLRLVPKGWWDYHLPSDWFLIGGLVEGLFGGVKTIKVATTAGAPVGIELDPGVSSTLEMPYLGFWADPVNMFPRVLC